MSKSISILLPLFLVGASTACGGASGESTEPATHAHATSEGEAMKTPGSCPFGAPDVQLVLDDVDGGATLTATGPEQRVADLRAMAQRMAAMHERHAGADPMHGEDGAEHGEDSAEHGHHDMHAGEHDGHHGDGDTGHGSMHDGDTGHEHGNMHDGDTGHERGSMHDGDMMMMPEAEITVEEIAGGVRMVIKASDADEVDSLRAHLREHVAMMKEGKCHDDGASAAPAAEHPKGAHQH